MRRLIKWLIILGVLVGVMIGISLGLQSWWNQRLVPRFQTAAVSRGKVETVVNSTGTIKPVRSVSVGAFASGPIAKIKIDYNSVVSKGDLLALIDPKLQQAALDAAKATLDRDNAALQTQIAERKRLGALLQQGKNNWERAEKLRKINKDYISDTDMDTYYFTWKTAEAQVDLADANVVQAKANVAVSTANMANADANLGYTTINSPVDGIVIERKVDPGQTVAASFQTPEMFIIGEEMEQHMHVFASVDEADIGLIRTAQENGEPVKFTVDAYPGDLFEGKIHQIRKNSTTTQNVVTYPVVIDAPNPELKLMPGMTANLSFQIQSRENVLRIPASALRFVPLSSQVRSEDRHYLETPTSTDNAGKRSAADKAERSRSRHQRVVWVREGEVLRAVPVTLGLMENQFAELLEGDLKEGQQLVTGTESALAAR